MPNPVVWFEIVGKDGKALQDFYANLFGWKIDANNPMNYGIVEKEGAGIGGGICTNPGQNGVTVYVAVSDMEATLKKAEELGGKVVVPITEIPNMVTFAMFEDIEGNKIGILKSMD
jgi:uncharacterized protein